VEVDREIVMLAPQSPSEGDIREQPGETAAPRHDDDLVEVRVAGDDRSSCGFDEVSEVRIRKPAAQRGHGWCRENHIANLPEANNENTVELVSWRSL
jgi:hypothetical protein